MKNTLLFALAFGLLLAVSCKKDDDTSETDFQYKVTILSPDAADKHVGDTINIDINFESLAGETVHHVNVRIYNKTDESMVVFDEPAEAHIHATDGLYELKTDFVLSAANEITEHTDWILEAKVWGDVDGLGEVVEMIEFHVHP